MFSNVFNNIINLSLIVFINLTEIRLKQIKMVGPLKSVSARVNCMYFDTMVFLRCRILSAGIRWSRIYSHFGKRGSDDGKSRRH